MPQTFLALLNGCIINEHMLLVRLRVLLLIQYFSSTILHSCSNRYTQRNKLCPVWIILFGKEQGLPDSNLFYFHSVGLVSYIYTQLILHMSDMLTHVMIIPLKIVLESLRRVKSLCNQSVTQVFLLKESCHWPTSKCEE